MLAQLLDVGTALQEVFERLLGFVLLQFWEVTCTFHIYNSLMDYQKAINNLHAILTNEEKFSEINKSIFDAIDTDNSGTLERDEVESFVKSLLVGIHPKDEEYD